MIRIEEPKIAGLTPRWAPFPGFSILFDAPRTVFRREGGIETLACDVDGDPALEFYRRVLTGFRSLGPDRLLQAYGLCPLPSESYHVTAFDVANVADFARCHIGAHDRLKATLDLLPRAEAFDDEMLTRATEFARATWNLAFGYGELCFWGRVIVVRLEPLDAADFGRFTAARAALSREYRAEFGVGAGEKYTPHLSLGYFMNSEGADLAHDHQREWDEAVRSAAGEARLEFRSASLYGFTDMATFFRRA